MAHYIELGEDGYWVSNRLLDRMLSMAVEAIDRSALTGEERVFFDDFVERVEAGQYWPGYPFDILKEFPPQTERMLFARIFVDTAQAVFEREVGVHSNSAWQTMTIHQLHKLAQLFVDSVQQEADGDVKLKSWYPDTRAREESKKL